MTDERFNTLITGPLDHPMIPLKITRLILALREVTECAWLLPVRNCASTRSFSTAIHSLSK